mmetsp:Transcript_33024/g.58151  ORF Transcript_33024/g.58151 Transcript_33024/m.58151 type:complete len:83 (-) Transcript_33024:248-496(-)
MISRCVKITTLHILQAYFCTGTWNYLFTHHFIVVALELTYEAEVRGGSGVHFSDMRVRLFKSHPPHSDEESKHDCRTPGDSM